jgi:hypothetical protein
MRPPPARNAPAPRPQLGARPHADMCCPLVHPHVLLQHLLMMAMALWRDPLRLLLLHSFLHLVCALASSKVFDTQKFIKMVQFDMACSLLQVNLVLLLRLLEMHVGKGQWKKKLLLYIRIKHGMLCQQTQNLVGMSLTVSGYIVLRKTLMGPLKGTKLVLLQRVSNNAMVLIMKILLVLLSKQPPSDYQS